MRIHQLSIATDKLDEQLEFYSQVLGLPVLEQTSASLTLQVGASRLTFEPAKPGARPFYHFAFNIPSNQLGEAKVWAERRVKLIQDRHGADTFRSENWDAHQFYFYDPAGNILELIARHTLNNRSDTPFSPSSLLNLSEIVIVCDDVPATVRRLQGRTGAPLYRTELNDSFVPLGDEHGLFILVRRSRVWFPDTGKAAEPAPFRINFSPNGRPAQTLTESDI
jgi:catechol-2,3-dioxygenase